MGRDAGGFVAGLNAATTVTLSLANGGWSGWAGLRGDGEWIVECRAVCEHGQQRGSDIRVSCTDGQALLPLRWQLRAGGTSSARSMRQSRQRVRRWAWFPKAEEIDREELVRFGRILDRRPVSLEGLTVMTALAAQMLRVRTRDGRTEPLYANEVQRAFEARRGSNNIVLKARQMGLTTWAAARFFLKTITQPGTLTLEVAHTQEAAESIFRIVHRFVDCLPEPLRKGPLRTSRSNMREIVFPALDAQYLVVSAGERNAGRGLTVQNLHCRELARWPGEPAETLAGLRAAMAPDGGLILESTPEGVGGCFYEEWEKAAETGMVRHFFPWWMERSYRVEGVNEQELDDGRAALMAGMVFDLEQIGFPAAETAELRGTAAQEYAEDEHQLFQGERRISV